MTRMSRFLHLVAICGISSTGLVTAAQAATDHKLLICHGTASETNPYVLISIDAHALEGHFDGTDPGHGQNNHPDLLPNADGTCGSGEE